YPLMAMGLVSARGRIWPPRSESAAPDSWVPGLPVDVVYSDVGPLTTFDDAPWRPGRPKTISALLDPGAPSAVSVFSGTISGERTISMTFHDNVHDRDSIRAAVRAIQSDPIRFLRQQ